MSFAQPRVIPNCPLVMKNWQSVTRAIFSKHVLRLSLLAVIKMEGGMENDLRILEQPTEEEEERERLSSGGPGSEAPKRDEPRPVDVELKPSTEKDKMVSECCITEQNISQYWEDLCNNVV